MATLTVGPKGLDTDTLGQNATSGTLMSETATSFTSKFDDGETVVFTGTGFTFDDDGLPTAGTITEIGDSFQGLEYFHISGLSAPATSFVNAAADADISNLFDTALKGSDTIIASDLGDSVATLNGHDSFVGGGGADELSGGTGDNTILGNGGADTLSAGNGFNTLFGGDGDDLIQTGADHNVVNGNKGDDTVIGSSNIGDWLLGGQGNDLIDATASHGHNILNGNLGEDTIFAGVGGDSLRGGQGDDLITGGVGADWLSGDLGNNTLHGGAGADTFHAAAGHDVVDDFSYAEGDRVQVTGGVHYTATQVGADVHVDLDGGGELVLQHTTLANLPQDWIIAS
jgi:Ca2+-binding RTX toxin-like protein